MRAPALALLLALGACAAPPPPEPAAPAPDPGVSVLINATGQRARDQVHLLAVRCWRYIAEGATGEVLVDQSTGKVIVIGDAGTLIVADYDGLKGANSRWKLSGISIDDPDQARLIVRSVDQTNETGEFRCPGIDG